MRKLMFVMVLAVLMVAVFAVPAMAYTFPSTNDLNKAQLTPGHEGRITPYVELVSRGSNQITLKFVGGWAGGAYFEYRIDGQVLASGITHQVVTEDFEYPGVWVPDTTPVERTFEASDKIEIRLALGPERDWDFDWVTFDVADVITSPTVGQVVWGAVTLSATSDSPGGATWWAVRLGTDAANTGTVAGNVDGFNTPGAQWMGTVFSCTIDVSTWQEGTYYFVFNHPVRGRYSRMFYIIASPHTASKEQAMANWEAWGFKNQGQAIRYIETGKDSRVGA